MNNNLTALDYLSAMRAQPYSSGYAQAPGSAQSTFHSPQGTQGGGLINSFCGLGGKGKTAPGSAASQSAPMAGVSNSVDVPYRTNGLQLGGSTGSWA